MFRYNRPRYKITSGGWRCISHIPRGSPPLCPAGASQCCQCRATRRSAVDTDALTTASTYTIQKKLKSFN